jgi:hypothetical protein
MISVEQVIRSFRRMSLPVALIWATGAPVHASPLNDYPPAGPLVLNLAGQPLPSVYTEYSASFVATTTSSVITFAFRNDPGWFAFDNVSAFLAGGGPNLLGNDSFQSGTLGAWRYFAQSGISYTGFVGNSSSVVGLHPWNPPVLVGSHDWLDGSTGGYDGISQSVTTTIGDTYDITFWLDQRTTQSVSVTNFQEISTNGQGGVLGNGIDVLVYAGASLPSTTSELGATPLPAALPLFATGLGSLGLLGWRRKRKARVID